MIHGSKVMIRSLETQSLCDSISLGERWVSRATTIVHTSATPDHILIIPNYLIKDEKLVTWSWPCNSVVLNNINHHHLRHDNRRRNRFQHYHPVLSWRCAQYILFMGYNCKCHDIIGHTANFCDDIPIILSHKSDPNYDRDDKKHCGVSDDPLTDTPVPIPSEQPVSNHQSWDNVVDTQSHN